MALQFPVNLILFQLAYRVLVFSVESKVAHLLEVVLFRPIAKRETLHIIQKKLNKCIVLLSVYVLGLNSSLFMKIRKKNLRTLAQS